MDLTRRHLLKSTFAAMAMFSDLRGGRSLLARTRLDLSNGFGPLVADPACVLDLPEGFSYVTISRFLDGMDDGLVVPNGFGGMAAFLSARGKVLLIRNHELARFPVGDGPFGQENELMSRLAQHRMYDVGSESPPLGGTTSLLYDPASKRLEGQFQSLAGTARNGGGGRTPWGSWLSCEELVGGPGGGYEKAHGHCFEVPATVNLPSSSVTPLEGMGRFNHEAVMVEPAAGCVYQTEDRPEGLLYRFVPHRRGILRAGGRLQALSVRDSPGQDTRNWNEESHPIGLALDTAWLDIDDVTSPRDDLRSQGVSRGAAMFSRGGGLWVYAGSIYFHCNGGGPRTGDAREGRGQIWCYTPSPFEGAAREERQPGRLELVYQADVDSPPCSWDDFTPTPWGDLFITEDRDRPGNRILGLSRDGRCYEFARNAGGSARFSGATFGPDGRTLFVNLHTPGRTFAIVGPWQAQTGAGPFV